MASATLKPLVLHAHASGLNSVKVAIVLETLFLPYTVKLWVFGDGPNGVKGATFTKINENGRVPVLEDPNTGVVFWESLAVIHYLLRVYDKGNLLGPQGPTEQDHVDFDKWISVLISALGPIKNEDALDRYTKQVYQYYGTLDGSYRRVVGRASYRPASVLLMHTTIPGSPRLSLDGYPYLKKWYEAISERKDTKAAEERIAKAEPA